ncbi:hypothetical protein C4565_00485 [Candidatus Parcubacteria bacterium]|nr:MAG: hypothetical protein C4565_00485 [Candidatus Parcubacteria bacterium]
MIILKLNGKEIPNVNCTENMLREALEECKRNGWLFVKLDFAINGNTYSSEISLKSVEEMLEEASKIKYPPEWVKSLKPSPLSLLFQDSDYD